MRFEKLSENKIRIILNSKDLKSNNMDFHFFMSNPIESQKLFLDILNRAEKEIGFKTKNYNLKIDAYQISTGDFILTITRSIPVKETLQTNRRYTKVQNNEKTKKKTISNYVNNSSNCLVYFFDSFDDFCAFASFINNSLSELITLDKGISLYEYKNKYFLVFSNIINSVKNADAFLTAINEFATYINNGSLFRSYLIENGKLIMKNNAIKKAVKYFF